MAAVSVKRSIVSLRNRTSGRRGRLNAWVWQTWQGYNLRVLSWSSLNINMSFGLLGKYLFKGRWSSAESFFKQNYCQACHTGFSAFFPLPSSCVSLLFTRTCVSYLRHLIGISLSWIVASTQLSQRTILVTVLSRHLKPVLTIRNLPFGP